MNHKYEPFSERLHISAKWLFFNRKVNRTVQLSVSEFNLPLQTKSVIHFGELVGVVKCAVVTDLVDSRGGICQTATPRSMNLSGGASDESPRCQMFV